MGPEHEAAFRRPEGSVYRGNVAGPHVRYLETPRFVFGFLLLGCLPLRLRIYSGGDSAHEDLGLTSNGVVPWRCDPTRRTLSVNASHSSLYLAPLSKATLALGSRSCLL